MSEIEIAALQREITVASVQLQQGEEPERSRARAQVLEKLGEAFHDNLFWRETPFPFELKYGIF